MEIKYIGKAYAEKFQIFIAKKLVKALNIAAV
ncbi:MAG: hypothetical protein XD85_0071 [Parcubacteria bacterium 34_609]|nr:MAG: hypothetical protein XD85_0071 [Parcubacteria bacterium 34_609]KUK99434.1 MAG: hypothetical protein XE08_0027 [Parcubacteria bacterium 32_520]